MCLRPGIGSEVLRFLIQVRPKLQSSCFSSIFDLHVQNSQLLVCRLGLSSLRSWISKNSLTVNFHEPRLGPGTRPGNCCVFGLWSERVGGSHLYYREEAAAPGQTHTRSQEGSVTSAPHLRRPATAPGKHVDRVHRREHCYPGRALPYADDAVRQLATQKSTLSCTRAARRHAQHAPEQVHFTAKRQRRSRCDLGGTCAGGRAGGAG